MSATPSATKAKRAHQIVRRELLRLVGRLSATYGVDVVAYQVRDIMEKNLGLADPNLNRELDKSAPRA